MEQPPATNPGDASATQPSATNASDASATQAPRETPRAEAAPDAQPGFRTRGRARRRARFLRRARELAYRDLGGLVYNLHRFSQRNDALVLAKLSTLGHIDDELRAIETAIDERKPVTVLREAGITACPRCAAIHGSEDRFCPNCGLPMSRHADLPVAGAPTGDPPVAPAAAQPQTAAPVTAVHAVPGSAPGQQVAPRAPQPAVPSTSTAAVPAVPASAPPTRSRDSADTGRHATVGSPPVPASGRSPLPPESSHDGAGEAKPASASGPEEPTEIIRPQAPGT